MRQARKGFTVRCFSGCRPGRAPQGSSAGKGRFAPVQAGWTTDMQLGSGLDAFLPATAPPRGQDDSRLHGCAAQTGEACGRKVRGGSSPHRVLPSMRGQPGDVASRDRWRSSPISSLPKTRQRNRSRDHNAVMDVPGGSSMMAATVALPSGSAASASKPPPRVKPSMPLNSTAALPWPRSSPEGPASMPASLGGRRRASVDARPSE